MTTRHRTNHPLLSLCVLAALALFLSGCSVWHYVATDTAGRAQAVTYTAQTSAYHLRVVATHHDGTCAKRVLYYDARSGLHTRPNVSEAHAVDRDCDMLIDRVRLTRASDARMYRLFQWQIRRDLQAAYHKALTR
jgi:hypothetical protein